MSSPRTVAASDSRWLPELDHRGLVNMLLVLGLTGMVAELASTMFVPRMVLYMLALAAATVGLVRRQRVRQRTRSSTPAVLHRVG
jgi:hypothetical protein